MPISATAIVAAMEPARQQQVPGFLAKERHGLRRLHGDAHHRAGGAIDAARQVHGDNGFGERIDGLD